MVVWNMRWPCVVVLCLLSTGQWILAVLGTCSFNLTGGHYDTCWLRPSEVVVKTRAAWYSISGCLLSHTPTREISALFLYSSCFDFIVLLLSAVRLLTVNATKRSKLANLLFQDGLIYVVVAFVLCFLKCISIVDQNLCFWQCPGEYSCSCLGIITA